MMSIKPQRPRPLTCLMPDIVEAILDGRLPKGLSLAEILGMGRWAGTSSERVGASGRSEAMPEELQ
jgi:hypothetical protein